MTSEYLRKEGNKLYLRGTKKGLSPLLAKARLTGALKYYHQAKTSCLDRQELSSCLKNIGKTHYHIARIKANEFGLCHVQAILSEKEKLKIEDGIRYHAKESLSTLFAAFKHGEHCQDETWCDKMQSDIGNIFSDLVAFVGFLNFDRRIAAMFVLAEYMMWKEMKALALLEIATVLHQHSVSSLEQQDFRASLRAVHEMNYPLEEAARLTDHDEMQTDVRVLKADALYQQASAESMQAISMARHQLTNFLQDDEFLNMNMVFNTLDMFKDAALKAREINLEQEAIACYYQGHIFEKILKLKQKGKTFYLQVMQLTEAAKPKLFNGQEWYDDCTASLRAMQDEARERDDNEQEKIRQAFRKEMEKELNDIAAAKTAGAVQLLKHVYAKHPPKNTPFKLDIKDLSEWDSLETKDKKRLLLKALSDFHPDKNSKADYGEKWHFLVGEISKAISHFHDNEKSLMRGENTSRGDGVDGDATEDKTGEGDDHEGGEDDDADDDDDDDDDEWTDIDSSSSEYGDNDIGGYRTPCFCGMCDPDGLYSDDNDDDDGADDEDVDDDDADDGNSGFSDEHSDDGNNNKAKDDDDDHEDGS